MLSNRVHLVAKRSRFELRPQVHDLIWRRSLPPELPPLEAIRYVHLIAIAGTGWDRWPACSRIRAFA